VEILFLHPGGLGDIILSLPAVALFRRQFPAARIAIAGNLDHLAPVITGYAERTISLSTLPLHHFYTPEAMLQHEVKFWRSFGRIVSWTGSGNEEFVRKLKEIHSDACIASWRPGPEEPRHVSRLFVDSLGLGIPLEMEVMPAHIHISAALRDEGAQWLASRGWSHRDPLIALHPGAGSKIKRWALNRFVKLAQLLVHQGTARLLIIEGPAESGLGREMVQAFSAAEAILAESVSLSLLAAIIEQCNAFVGNDSGLAHLAAGLRVPSVVLFGPALPQHWAPLGRNVIVLRNPHGCKACAMDRGEHTCLDNISVDEVRGNLEFLTDQR
jgi:ADP-heptose:LPS heptosyltransferase